MRMHLEEILKAAGGQLTRPQAPGLPRAKSRGPRPLIITGVSTDTRTLQPGDLFVPLRGLRADGHAFIAEAFRRGAAASLCSPNRQAGAPLLESLPPDAVLIQVPDPLRALGHIAHVYRRALAATVVGVTGSVGKTTTTKMCAAVLGTRFKVAQSKEEWNAEVGVPLTLLGLRADHQVAVIEMAMRGRGQIAELVSMAEPTIGVVTTIGETHLEFLGSRENIARAKGELIAGLPPEGTAVLNADDPLVAGLESLCRGRVLTYGVTAVADVRAYDLRHDRMGIGFQLTAANQRTAVHLPAWGRHNVSNALAAAAVGVVMGLELRAIGDGLARYTPPKMRLQAVSVREALVIDDAYNASPTSMRAAFDVLEEVGRGHRLVAVLGEMKELGPQSPALHRHVGEDLARRKVALLVTVGEDADAIAEGAAGVGMDRTAILRTRSVEEAAARLTSALRPGDVVLVKGSRALEMERIIEMLQRES